MTEVEAVSDTVQPVATGLVGGRTPAPPTVTIAHAVYPLMLGRPFRFGRRGHLDVVGLDPTDVGISRTAGELTADGGVVAITNTSRKRPLRIEYPTIVRHVRVPPGQTHVFTGPALLLVAGDVWTHPLRISTASTAAPSAASVEGESTYDTTLSDAEREAVAAIADSYLARWPRHEEDPLPYEDAARIAGLEETTLRKRIEHLRERLNGSGSFSAAGTHALRALVDQLIDGGLLGVADRLEGERAR